jgi:glycosyltransferase involved in cell wall biosynthesis
VAFILDHRLMPYRVGFFQRLGALFDVTVIHRGPAMDGNHGFAECVTRYRKVFGFELLDIPNLSCFNVVVAMQNLRFPQFWLLPLVPKRRWAIVYWGIGVSSQGGLARRRGLATILRDLLASLSDGVAFYSRYPLRFYSARTLSRAVVVGNSVESPLCFDSSSKPKNRFLFIGALEGRKGLPILIRAFEQFLRGEASPKRIELLRIVGDGPLREEIVTLVGKLGMAKRVVFEGSVLDAERKRAFFSDAVACFSPCQAGLSVVESFSFGVPFVTARTPVSGGEFLSIEDGVTGFFCQSGEDLSSVMRYFDEEAVGGAKMGAACFELYKKELHISEVVGRFETLIRDACARFEKARRM